MSLDFCNFLAQLLDLVVHHNLLLVYEIQRLFLVKLNEEFTAYLDHDSVHIQSFSLHVKLVTDIEAHVHLFELLFSG